MEVTQKTVGIIIKREAFFENDSRVFIYSHDFGKIDLIARGTSKITSKLSGHIEPLNLCEIMIIKGKYYDYLGSAISSNEFLNIKNNYHKSKIAGETLAEIDKMIKGQQCDEKVFFMLYKFLEVLDNDSNNYKESWQVLQSAFIIKLITLLGYQPDLNNLQATKEVINMISWSLRQKFSDIIFSNFSADVSEKFFKSIDNYKRYIFD